MDDSSNHDVSQWIEDIKNGSLQKMEDICTFYMQILTRTAEKKIHDKGVNRRMLEGDDFANSVLSSVAIAAREKRIPDWVTNRKSMWGLLASKLHNKVVDALRKENAQKRGGGNAPIEPSGEEESAAIGDIPDSLTQAINTTLLEIRDELNDPELHDILNLALEGFDKDEIAQRIGRSPRTVERKFEVIRKLLEDSERKEAQ